MLSFIGRAKTWRIVLAGPLAFVTSIIVMAGSALWLPKGAADIDNIVLPVVFFPLIWTLLFFYSCLDQRLTRAYLVVGALLAAHIGLIVFKLLAGGAA